MTAATIEVGAWRAIAEAVRVPEPRRRFQLRLRKRGADQSFREIWSTTVDPASRFVDRAPLPRGQAHVIQESGPPAAKVDLLIMGDGYTAEQMDKYHADATRMAEALFTGLRLVDGVDSAAFAARYGSDPLERFGERLDDAFAAGLLASEAGRLRLTDRGMLLSNEVFQLLV